MKRYGERLEALDARLDALRDREDGTYQAQKERVHARRYAPPRVEPVLELIFEAPEAALTGEGA